MPSNPFLQNEDQFIVGKKSDNKTYKTTFDGLKHDIGLNIGTAPSDPIDGSIWVDTSSGECPPPVYIWAECDNTWHPIGGDGDEKFLQYNATDDVYIPGNLYIKGQLITAPPTLGSKGTNTDNTIEITASGDVVIEGSVFVNSNYRGDENDIYTGQPYVGFDGVEDVLFFDGTKDIVIPGNLVVAGDIITDYTPLIPFRS